MGIPLTFTAIIVFLCSLASLYAYLCWRWAKRQEPEILSKAPLGSSFKRIVRVFFIKPSKYDDNGYVFQFWKGIQPTNTLTTLAALNDQYNQTHQGSGVHLETVIWEELVQGAIDTSIIEKMKKQAEKDGVELLIGMAGVQTNQYPRARDLAFQFKAAGLPVLIGGFQVSLDTDVRNFLQSHGITTVSGEAESQWENIIKDFLSGSLASHYKVTEGIRVKAGGAGYTIVPDIENAPLPIINNRYKSYFNPHQLTLETSRGCPFECSFCCVWVVLGRRVRARDPKAVVDWIRHAVYDHEISDLQITDDNFYRNPHWQYILEGMAAIRREGKQLHFHMQVDVEASQNERFLRMAKEAGCTTVFIGFENFNPDNLQAATKHQNLTDKHSGDSNSPMTTTGLIKKYRRIVDNWHSQGIAAHAAYILGFPHDTRTSGLEAGKYLRATGVDLATFFHLTTGPGTEYYKSLKADGGDVEEFDLNQYDGLHPTLRHPVLDKKQMENNYNDAFRSFYSLRNILKTIFTWHGGKNLPMHSRSSFVKLTCYYAWANRVGRHPLFAGLFRTKNPKVKRLAITDQEAARIYLFPNQDKTNVYTPAIPSLNVPPAN